MRNLVRWSFVCLAGIALLGSCSGEFSLLSTGVMEPQALIETIPNGRIVSPGSTVPLAVRIPAEMETAGTAPDSMLVELRTAESTLIASTTLSEDVLLAEQIPPLALPRAVEDGLYTFIFKLYNGPTLAQENSVMFFITNETYSLGGITSYPPSLYPGATGILEALLGDIPESSDPFLVWKTGDEPFAYGPVREGFSEVEWAAPKTEGVYRVRLELYPTAPSDGTLFPFTSPLYIDTEIFVTKKPPESGTELSDGTQYAHLFHFRGDLRNEGTGTPSEPDPGTVFGRPGFAKSTDIFGYAFDGASGFSFPASLLPVHDGTLQPFTLELRLKALAQRARPPQGGLTGQRAGTETRLVLGNPAAGFEDRPTVTGGTEAGSDLDPLKALQPDDSSAAIRSGTGTSGGAPLGITSGERDILVSTADGGEFTFRLLALPDGRPVITVGSRSGAVRSELALPVLAAGSPAAGLAVSVVPVGEALSVLWFVDGRAVQTDRLVFDPSPIPADGTTWVGSDGYGTDFIGIIDELGLYTRDELGRPSPHAGLFRESRQKLYGRDLVFADGFDGLYLPDWTRGVSGIALLPGTLVLQPGASVTLPAALPDVPMVLELTLPADSVPSGVIEIVPPGSEAGTADSAEATVSIPFESLDVKTEASAAGILLTVLSDDLSGVTDRPSSGTQEQAPVEHGARVRIVNSSDSEALSLDSVCLRTAESIAVEPQSNNP